MRKIKNILFILVALLLVVVKVEAADYGISTLGETAYDKVWENSHITQYDDEYSDVVFVSDGILALGSNCKSADSSQCYGLIEKYDNNGSEVWSKEYNLKDTSFVAAIEVEDGYAVVLVNYATSGVRDISLVKYSYAGEKVWETNLVTGIEGDKLGYAELSYYNGLISAVFGDANVFFVNDAGVKVKELTMSIASYPLVKMDKNGIYVVRNVLDEATLSMDLVFEVYDRNYSLVNSVVLYDSEFDATTNVFNKLAIAEDFDIVNDKFVVVLYEGIEDYNSNMILNDKYEVVKTIKYASDYRVYENEEVKDGFVSLIGYFHNDGTDPTGAMGIEMDTIPNLHDARVEYESGNFYMMVKKYTLAGDELWKVDLDFDSEQARIDGKDEEFVVVVNISNLDEDGHIDHFDAHIYKYGNGYEVTTKTDGNGEIVFNRVNNEVEFTITPKEGYKLVKVTVTTLDGDKVEFTDNKFTMPNEDVVISVEFEKIPENPNTGLSNPLLIFGSILGIALIGSLVVKKKKFI